MKNVHSALSPQSLVWKSLLFHIFKQKARATITLIFFLLILPLSIFAQFSETFTADVPDVIRGCTPVTYTVSLTNSDPFPHDFDVEIITVAGVGVTATNLNGFTQSINSSGHIAFNLNNATIPAFTVQYFSVTVVFSDPLPTYMIVKGAFKLSTDPNLTFINSIVTGISGVIANNINISQLGSNNQTIMVEGTLTIDVNTYISTTIDPNARIKMGQGAKIVVPNGKFLQLAGITVSGCANRWQSIEVQTGGVLSLLFNTIKDGETALRLLPNPNTNFGFWGNSFIDCNTGILGNDVSFGVWGCLFRGTGQMLPLTGNGIVYARPRAGIDISGNSAINMTSVGFLDAPYFARYENLDEGVIATNSSSVSAYNTRFYNCEYGIHSVGWGSSVEDVQNIYNNCTYGLSSQSADYLYVGNTFMSNISGIGVNALQSSYATIENNNISAKVGIRTAWNIGNSSNSTHTIMFNQVFASTNDWDIYNTHALKLREFSFSGGWRASRNSFETDNAIATVDCQSGKANNISDNRVYLSGYSNAIGINLSGMKESMVGCNLINGLGNGKGVFLTNAYDNIVSCNDANSTNIGFNFLGSSQMVNKFRGNEMKSNYVGLQIEDNSNIGTQNDGGNKFLGSFSGPYCGAHHVSTDPVIRQLSLFFVDKQAGIANGSAWWPFPTQICEQTQNFDNWFTDHFTSSGYICSTNNCPFGIGGEPGFSEEQLSLMNRNNSGLSESALWTSQRQLYRTVKRNSQAHNNANANRFVSQLTNTSVGQLFALEEGFKDYFLALEQKQEVVRRNSERLKELYKSVRDNNEKIQTANKSAFERLDKENQRLMRQIQDISKQNKAHHTSLSDWKRNELGSLQRRNQAIAGTQLFEQNQKDVFRIALSVLGQETMQLNREDIAILERIANLCPVEGGEAVHDARSLLAIVDDKYYDDAQLCNLSNSREPNQGLKVQKTDVPSAVKVYPNPANAFITIECTVGADEVGSVKLTNILGKEVIVKSLSPNSSNHTINTSDLPQGMYIVTIEKNGQTVLTKKLQIQK